MGDIVLGVMVLFAPSMIAATPSFLFLRNNRWGWALSVGFIGFAAPLLFLIWAVMDVGNTDIGPAIIVAPLLPWLIGIPYAIVAWVAAVFLGRSAASRLRRSCA